MRFTPIFLAMLMLGGLVTAPAHGQDLGVCGYVAPSSALTSLTLNGNYHQFDDRYADDRGNADNGDLALTGLKWVDRPEWGYRLEGSADLRFSSSAVSLDYTVDSNSDFRRYLNENVFAFGGLDTRGTPAQAGFTVDALAGGGYGRFRNVTPLAKAFATVELLSARGVLEERPADEALMALAQRIDEQEAGGLTAALLKEVESQFGVTLSLADTLALNGLLSGNISRFCGWDATLSAGYPVISPADESVPMLRAAANYATAIDPQTQLVANARFSTPLSLDQAFSLTGQARYERTLSARASLSASYRYSGEGQLGGSLSLTETHTLDGSLRVQVSSALSALFKGKVSLNTHFEEPEWSVDASFRYDLF